MPTPELAQSEAFAGVNNYLEILSYGTAFCANFRIRNHVWRQSSGSTHATIHSMDNFIFVKTGKSFVKIDSNDLVVIKGLGNYVQLQTTDCQKHTVYKSLKGVIEKLPDDFMRVHNSYIVNIRHIDKVEDNHVFIAGEKISVSSNYRQCLLERIEQHQL